MQLVGGLGGAAPFERLGRRGQAVDDDVDQIHQRRIDAHGRGILSDGSKLVGHTQGNRHERGASRTRSVKSRTDPDLIPPSRLGARLAEYAIAVEIPLILKRGRILIRMRTTVLATDASTLSRRTRQRHARRSWRFERSSPTGTRTQRMMDLR